MKIISFVTVALAASLPQAALADAAGGAKLFKQKCAVCHSVTAGQNRVGPSLAGIFGRKVGAVPGFRYSPGYAGSKVKWDAAGLDKYLANPTGMFPGSRMGFKLPAAADRAAIIAYLRTNPKS